MTTSITSASKPSQLVSCAAAADGTECDIINTQDGVCDRGGCVFATCGDGYRKTSEACDGANNPVTCESLGYYEAGSTACTADCAIDRSVCVGYCGDGMVTAGREVCDVGVDPVVSCVDFGYAAGVLGCNMCAPGIEDCKSYGWQYLPTGFVPYDVHGTSDTNVFAVGDGGAAHFDGVTWTPVDLGGCFSGAIPKLNHVWAVADNDAFATIELGPVVHLGPAGCTMMASGPTNASDVWALADDNVYVSTSSDLQRWDGAAWSIEQTGTYTGVWGSGAGDVWAVTNTGSASHWDGGQWTTSAVPTMTVATSVWGTGPNDVYVGGKAGTEPYVARQSGGTWSSYFVNAGRFSGLQMMVLGGWTVVGRSVIFGFVVGSMGSDRTFILTTDGSGWHDPGAPQLDMSGVYRSPTGRIFVANKGSPYVSQLDMLRRDTFTGVDQAGVGLVVRQPGEWFAWSLVQGDTFRGNGTTWTTEVDARPMAISVGPNLETFGSPVALGTVAEPVNIALSGESVIVSDKVGNVHEVVLFKGL